MNTETQKDSQPDRAELLRRQKEVRDRRLRDRQALDRRGGGKRHRHDDRSAHFKLRSSRKG